MLALRNEREAVVSEQAALYRLVNLDPKLHIVVSNRKTFSTTGEPIQIGKVFVIDGGKEYIEPVGK